MFCEKVDALKIALPWEKDAKITPLCEREKCKFLDGLVQDALSKGAKIVNPRGGKADRTIFSPAVLFPVKPDMRIFHEEQFGPIVPITTFKEVEDVLHHLEQSDFGQQAAIFTQNPDVLAPAIDALTNLVARVNINAQCQRGPDTFPFTARKDSATATLSVYDALRTFSMRSMIAVKETPENHKLIREVMKSDKSGFMSMDYYPS
jgi:glyceraldehyde-3-phosphate dehydrogenase (NADP+)